MDFLLSTHGLLYNAPALLLLALLLWKRPWVGVVMAVLAGLRGLPPLAGGPMIVPFSVHGALAFAAMFAWTRDDWTGNAVLFAGGLGTVFFLQAALGWLLPAASPDVDLGFVAGAIIAAGRAAAWGAVAAIRRP